MSEEQEVQKLTQEQWLAIKNNDKNYDGVFYYALKTTKTVCRPSCTARKCNPKNVIIFDTLEEALQQGFRPCQRCRSDQLDWEGAKKELTENAKKQIEDHYTEKFSLESLASALFVNENYLLRVFKEVTGHTLLWYHNQTRCLAAKKLLAHSDYSISFISCQVGFASSTHFSRVFKKMTGCTPSEYRKTHMEKFVP